ncbi:MAG: hypothetical protein K2M47_07770 [Clostridiales bacterium]|nr:hypothetical protein [Clostridiales bacterium]
MFLCTLQPYVVFIIIAAVLLQYAFAVFCLLKLAYTDLDKKRYILWNLFILIVFYIGGVVFLVYYSKHPELRISKDVPTENKDGGDEQKQEEKAEDQPAAPESEKADNADEQITDAKKPENENTDN